MKFKDSIALIFQHLKYSVFFLISESQQIFITELFQIKASFNEIVSVPGHWRRKQISFVFVFVFVSAEWLVK